MAEKTMCDVEPNESYSDFSHTCSSPSPEPANRSEEKIASSPRQKIIDGCNIPKKNEVIHVYRRKLIRRSAASSTNSGTCTSSDDDYESGDLSTCSESWEESWSAVNERKVTEVTLNYFYQPRTLTLLLVIIISLVVCAAFTRDDASDRQANIATGIYTFCFLFMAIGLLVFPNEPYTRPHPAIWRLVFGMSFLYLLFLSLLLFQSYRDIRMLLTWVDSGLNRSKTESYVIDCSITWNILYSKMDIFIPGHFVGWVFKAVLVRHTGVLWTISIMWECTERFFADILPDLSECWWDTIIFDILICNGCGIYVGMKLCKRLEVREFYWESIKDIKGTKGKLKRAVLQFTPQEWSQIRWLDPSSTYMRILAIFILILFFQITELNIFLLKNIFLVPTNHFLIAARHLLIMLIASPAVCQYYLYVTDKTCKRLGTQAWVYCSVMITEFLVAMKFGSSKLSRPAISFLFGWLGVMALLSVFVVLLITQTRIKCNVSNGWASVRSKVTGYEIKRRKKKRALLDNTNFVMSLGNYN